MLYFWRHYGPLTAYAALSYLFLTQEALLTQPLAFVTGTPAGTIIQWQQAILLFQLTLLVIRLVKRELIQGVMARRAGQEMPQLVNDLAGAILFLTGLGIILSSVFKKDITGFIAAGGASLMVLGLALRDMVLAAFTGVVLNIEKPFKPGDLVRLADKFQGRVERITWRVTVLQTATNELVYVPNLMLANAIIVNLDMPDKRSKRFLEVAIDYDTSVESAERILYAAALGSGVAMIGAPAICARKMERDGIVYEVAFTIGNIADGKNMEHAMIRSIVERMRDAGITVTFPKSEVIHSERRAPIANRALDSLNLVQQSKLFRGLDAEICQRIAAELIEHAFPKGKTIVRAGDATHSMFIVGEGLAKRVHTTRDGSDVVTDRFIATESFGRRSLFCLDNHAATVTAETDMLLYELTSASLTKIFGQSPELLGVMAHALAEMNWPPAGIADVDGSEFRRRVNLYRGQIEASYGESLKAHPNSGNSAEAA
ncbi:MAG: hypothetical protein CFE31_19510 [Rhizobiales bacterium PAR1]|nr:MAG: hypothetical protein CFE31_19510 [Rhizobiales bacterium PAR1]